MDNSLGLLVQLQRELNTCEQQIKQQKYLNSRMDSIHKKAIQLNFVVAEVDIAFFMYSRGFSLNGRTCESIEGWVLLFTKHKKLLNFQNMNEIINWLKINKKKSFRLLQYVKIEPKKVQSWSSYFVKKQKYVTQLNKLHKLLNK